MQTRYSSTRTFTRPDLPATPACPKLYLRTSRYRPWRQTIATTSSPMAGFLELFKSCCSRAPCPSIISIKREFLGFSRNSFDLHFVSCPLVVRGSHSVAVQLLVSTAMISFSQECAIEPALPFRAALWLFYKRAERLVPTAQRRADMTINMG
jgi:hypothetical protein